MVCHAARYRSVASKSFQWAVLNNWIGVTYSTVTDSVFQFFRTSENVICENSNKCSQVLTLFKNEKPLKTL